MKFLIRLFLFCLFGFLAGCSAFNQLTSGPSQPNPETHQVGPAANPVSASKQASNAAKKTIAAIEPNDHPPKHTVESSPLPASPDPNSTGKEAPAADQPQSLAGDNLINEQQVEDLWQRIRAGYQLDLNNNQKRVQQEIRWYTRHPAYLTRTFSRAEPYLYYIVEQAEKKKVPLELTLLPIVESAFDPFAYSHGRAAGIWQFIPGTGKQYGLKQNWWYDGRRDIPASTQAALNYLTDLAERFDGNWLLALAAYNSGAGTVSKAIKRNKKAGKPTDFWHLKLPRETSAYVPRLLAIATIIADPEMFRVNLEPIENKSLFEVVMLDSQIDLAKAAELAEISVDDLYLWNPGFNQWATDPLGPHQLAIPTDKIALFQTNLANLPKDQRVQWTRYKIKPGDSLIGIARKHKTTPAVLRDINNIRGSFIKAGDALLIPNSHYSAASYTLSADNRLANKQRFNPGKNTRKVTHTVKSGDTLWDISRKYRVNIRKLARWNNMAPTDLLRPGRKLTVWTTSRSETQVAALPSKIQNNREGVMRKIGYKVRKGDSLYKIANRYKVSISQLVAWNDIQRTAVLRPGQKLDIFVDVTKVN